MEEYNAYVGLDVHKETIAVAVAYPGRKKAESRGFVPNTKRALKNRSVDTALVCMTNFDQLDENLQALSEPFSDRDGELLASQLASIRPLYCRMCGSCGGRCEKGVPVPDILRYLSYAEGYGQFAMARERYLPCLI
jgi:predicted aldo/keto reductase-like oxidoreductase